MQPHGRRNRHQLPLHCPYLFRLRLTQCQIIPPNQQQLDQLQAIAPRLVLSPLQRHPHHIVELVAELLDADVQMRR